MTLDDLYGTNDHLRTLQKQSTFLKNAIDRKLNYMVAFTLRNQRLLKPFKTKDEAELFIKSVPLISRVTRFYPKETK
jgi:hypothetical protein